MTPARLFGFLALVFAFSAVSFEQPAWSQEEASSKVTLVYISAWNCPPCFVWARKHKPEFEASPARPFITFREVEAYRYQAIGDESIWPGDLQWVREKLNQRRGAPRWIIVDGKEFVAHGKGIRGWTKKIWPKLQQLVATKNQAKNQ